jgi:hypothetical protein
MAKLTPTQREALQRQLRVRVVLEQKLEQEIRRTFRRYTSQVTQFVRDSGVFYFPSEMKQELKTLLVRHYKRTARLFISFTRDSATKHWNTLQVNTKAWDYKVETKDYGEPELDTRIRIRLEELFEKISTERAGSITATTELEIRRYIDKIDTEAFRAGIMLSYEDIAKFTREYYYKRINSRALAISLTETTYPIETTKKIEVEEAIDDLNDDQLNDLSDTDDPDILAALDELSDGIDITEEDIADAGGLSALLAELTVTKTWIAVLDDVTRPEHADADGQEVPADEPFEVGGEALDYPGDDGGSPENVCNCRCSTIYSDGRDGEGE